MWEKLFPKKDFENGHPKLILALRSLGEALEKLGRIDLALPRYRSAWELSRAYYPGEHENKLLALLGYGHSLWVSRTPRDSPSEFLGNFEEAVAMGQRLYGGTGNPNLALSQVYLGSALAQLGPARADEAFAQFKAADAYYGRRYPAGHPHAAVLAQLQGDLVPPAREPRRAPRNSSGWPWNSTSSYCGNRRGTSRTPRRSPWAGSSSSAITATSPPAANCPRRSRAARTSGPGTPRGP